MFGCQLVLPACGRALLLELQSELTPIAALFMAIASTGRRRWQQAAQASSVQPAASGASSTSRLPPGRCNSSRQACSR